MGDESFATILNQAMIDRLTQYIESSQLTSIDSVALCNIYACAAVLTQIKLYSFLLMQAVLLPHTQLEAMLQRLPR